MCECSSGSSRPRQLKFSSYMGNQGDEILVVEEVSDAEIQDDSCGCACGHESIGMLRSGRTETIPTGTISAADGSVKDK